jgi:hypothetical protein
MKTRANGVFARHHCTTTSTPFIAKLGVSSI